MNSEIKNTQSQLRDVERLLKLDPSNTELLKQKQTLLAEAVGETKDKLDTLKEAERQAEEQFKQGKISEEQYNALKREITATEQQLKTLEDQAGKANTTLQQISIAGEKFQEVGQKIESAGKKLLPITAAVSGIGAAAVKTTADFDSSMSNVSAISGATGEDFDKLRNKAREMGAETKFSASEAADAMSYMAMAGWKTEDMLGGIGGIMSLAAASGADLATTSDIVTDALTGMGYTAADAGRLADVMAAASSNANTNVEMMGETFKYVAPVCGALGYSMEDTALAVGLMANSGIKASQAGTQLRSAITNMVKPTEAMEGVMNELGIEIANEDGSMKTLDETLKILRESFAVTTEEQKAQRLATLEQQAVADGYGDSLKGLTEEEKYFQLAMYAGQEQVKNMSEAQFKKMAQDKLGIKVTKKTNREQVAQNLALELGTQAIEGLTQEQQSAAAATLFGKEAMSGMLAIINASEEDYNKLSEAIANSEGAAKDMSEIMQDNLNGQLQILKSQLEEAAISIGDALMPKIRSLIAKIQEWTDWFNKLDESQKQTIATVGLFVAAIGPLLIMIGKVGTGIGAIMSAAQAMGSVLAVLSAAGGPILLTAVALGAIALAAHDAQQRSSEYYDEAVKLTDQEQLNKEKADELYDSYELMNQRRNDAAAGAEAEALKEQALFDELKNITDENGNVTAGYEERAQYILGELSTALGQEYEMTGNQIQNYKDMCASIDDLIVKKQANALLNANEEGYTEAIKNQTDAFMTYNNAQKDVEATKKALAEAQRQEARYQMELNALWAQNADTGVDVTNVTSGVNDKMIAASEAAKGYADKLAGLNQTLTSSEAAYVGYNTTIANYEGLSAAVISGDQQTISDAVLRTSNSFQTAETATKESLERQVQTLSEKYQAMKEAVDAGAPGITQTQVEQMRNLVNQSKLELDRLPDVVGNAADSSIKSLAGKSEDSKAAGQDVGLNYANGQAQGILDGQGTVTTAAEDVAEAGVGASKAALDINSPSGVMEDVGLDYDAGFANGMIGGLGQITDAASQVAAAAISATDTQLKQSNAAMLTYQTETGASWGMWATNLVTVITTSIASIGTNTSLNLATMKTAFFTETTAISMDWNTQWLSIESKHRVVMQNIRRLTDTTLKAVKTQNKTDTTQIKTDSITAMNEMVTGIGVELQNLEPTVRSGYEPSVKYIMDLIPQAKVWAHDMMDGYIQGIKDKMGELEAACRDVADTVSDYLHFTRPEKGPLRYYEEWMPHMMQGLAKGVRDNKSLIEDQIKDLAGGMTMVAQNTEQQARPVQLTSYNVFEVDGRIISEVVNEQLGTIL